MGHIPKIVEKAVKEYGKIDFLVNNAGAIRRAPVENYSEADWDAVVQTNLKGPFFLSQAVARTMIEAKRSGAIVNTASLIAYIGGKNVPAPDLRPRNASKGPRRCQGECAAGIARAPVCLYARISPPPS